MRIQTFILLLLTVATPTLARKKPKELPARPSLRIESLLKKKQFEVGQAVILQLRLVEIKTGNVWRDPAEVSVLAHSDSSSTPIRGEALPVGDGTYEAHLALRRPGFYYVFFESPTLKMRLQQVPLVELEVFEQSRGRELVQAVPPRPMPR